MKETERKYLLSLFIVFIVLMVAAVGSMVYAFVVIFQQGSILNNILELFYLGIHIIFLTMGIIFTTNALKSKKGSSIMRTLTVVPHYNVASIPARVISIVLSAFGFVVGVYFTLVLCGVPLPYFHFPIALLLDLVNAPFSLFIVGLYFFLYPFVYRKSLSEGQQ